MASMYIAPGSDLAVKKYSAALFTRMTRQMTFRKRNTGSAPQEGSAVSQLRRGTVTSAGMPFVEIRDLSKGAGDRASYDIVNTLRGKPIMGDRRLSGRMMKMDFATQEILINQYRGGVDPGGKMTKKRTVYDLRRIAMGNLEGWNNSMLDNITIVHLAGARGFQTGDTWSSVPFESDPDFNEILVNPVVPPTFNRRTITGGGTTTTDLDNTDVMSLDTIDQLRTDIDESERPLQGIRPDGSMEQSAEDDTPMYVLYVSPRGYQQLRDTNTDKDWNSLIAAALTRSSMHKHPLFGNGDLMWRNILIKQAPRTVRFFTGDSVRELDEDGVESTVTADVNFDRGILLGAQALAIAFGADENSSYHLSWNEEVTDHKNRVEISTSIMGGMQKLAFTLDGVRTDHGVHVIDYYNGIT